MSRSKRRAKRLGLRRGARARDGATDTQHPFGYDVSVLVERDLGHLGFLRLLLMVRVVSIAVPARAVRAARAATGEIRTRRK
jgi:hypothetical protein